MTKGMLIDITKCMGCRGCQVACKRYHDLEAETTTHHGDEGEDINYEWTNPRDQSSKTWTVQRFVGLEDADGNFMWRFWKNACFHCLDPKCVEACPADPKALTQETEGAVVTDAGLCIGCKSCTVGQGAGDLKDKGCPFGTPRYGVYGDGIVMMKCSMCVDRIREGLEPACATTCPTGAIIFGDRDTLLTDAKARITADSKYIDHIYGETEAGGTSILFLSDVEFSDLGFPDVTVPTKYKCIVEGCTEEFDTQAELDTHTATHPKCDVCDKRFNTQADLDAHLPCPDGPTTYKCPKCSDEFATEEARDAHIEEKHDDDGDEGLADWTTPAAVVVAAGVIGAGALYGLHRRKERVKAEEEELRREEQRAAKKKKSGKKKKKSEE